MKLNEIYGDYLQENVLQFGASAIMMVHIVAVSIWDNFCLASMACNCQFLGRSFFGWLVQSLSSELDVSVSTSSQLFLVISNLPAAAATPGELEPSDTFMNTMGTYLAAFPTEPR